MRAKENKGFRTSPIGLKEKEKQRFIHNLTFSGAGADVLETSERKAVLETRGRSVNVDTKWERVSERRLTGVMTEITTRIQGLRANFCRRKRYVGIAPGGAMAFACQLGDLVFVHLRLQFGWCGNPGS